MKLVFLLTYDVTYEHEHPFTRKVIQALIPEMIKRNHTIVFGTIKKGNDNVVEEDESIEGIGSYTLTVPASYGFRELVDATKNFINFLNPDIVHSNIAETFDIAASRELDIPIVNTVHIGGMVCPLGGGAGFLKYDGTLCRQPVSSQCERCLEHKLPLPAFAHMARALSPVWIRRKINAFLQASNKRILYISPLLAIDNVCDATREKIDILRYSHLIAGCKKLVELLDMNGLSEKVHLIPHGVSDDSCRSTPDIKDKVKFYYVGRLDESKGTEDLLNAFLKLDTDSAELHIIGDPGGKNVKNERLMNKYKSIGNRTNIFFYGRLPHADITGLVKDFHVMVHSARYLEVYGISIAEALGMGHPVIATKCGGAEMQIVDGKNGWLVEPNNVSSLYDKMKYVVEHPGLIADASRKCKIPHPMPEYIERLIDLYVSIIKKR